MQSELLPLARAVNWMNDSGPEPLGGCGCSPLVRHANQTVPSGMGTSIVVSPFWSIPGGWLSTQLGVRPVPPRNEPSVTLSRRSSPGS